MNYNNYFINQNYVNKVKNFLDDFVKITINRSFYDVNFINVVGELKSILDDMDKNYDRRFINLLEKVFEPVNNYSRTVSYSIYESSKNKYFISNFLKLYIILKAYQKQKDNYDNYSNILFDINSVSSIGSLADASVLSNNFKEIKDVVDTIVGLDLYSNSSNQRDILKRVYRDFICCDYYLNKYLERYKKALVIFEDAREIGCDKGKAFSIFDKMVSNCFVSVPVNEYFYKKTLLRGDRFEFVNNKLQEIESNPFIRRDIFSKIDSLSDVMFDYLNIGSHEDSYVSCLRKVFDSDSYYEMLSKLNDLNLAGNLFDNSDKLGALSLIRELDDNRHKKVYCGKLVSYPNNSINMVLKEKRIFRREKVLYLQIDPSISYDFMEELHYHSKGLFNMMNDTEEVISKDNVFRKIKRKNMLKDKKKC